MQAIVTKYHGPSNVRGSRYSATASAGKITLHDDNALNGDRNSALAAKALASRYNWKGVWIQSGLPNSNDKVWINASDSLKNDWQPSGIKDSDWFDV